MSNVTLRIRQEGTNVLVIKDGTAVLNMPWDAALAVAHEIIAKARLAEETAKAEDIIFDNALLFRSGAPFGLSNHPDIVKQSLIEAQHNTILRRSNMGGIKSQAVFGTPTIIQHPPYGGTHG